MLRCGFDQVVQILDTAHIIVITDTLHVAQKIFNTMIHLYQLQSIVISKKLCVFFNQHLNNSIEFWDCPSSENWYLHVVVDKKMKNFNLIPCKTSWDFNKKEDSDNIIKKWRRDFNMLGLKGWNFLNLLNNDYTDMVPSYTKGGPWLEQFSFSYSLCAQATQAITNHAPIGEYHLKFFLREDFSCLCGVYPLESRCHILYDCRRFNKYWNPKRNTIGQFISFLEFNKSAFSFGESTTWDSSFAAFYLV